MIISPKYGRINNFRELFNSSPDSLKELLCSLRNIPQKKKYHPEGNVLKHIITVVRRAIQSGDIELSVTALFHDLGKKDAYKQTIFGAPIAHGHEKASARYVFKYRKWIKEFGADPITIFNIVRQHMRVKHLHDMRRKKADKFRNSPYFDKIIRFSAIDRGGYDS